MEKKEIKKASALAYTPGGKQRSRGSVASGKGVNAEKNIEVAKKEKIPVVQDAHLAETLDKLRVGSENTCRAV
jgi:type III secretion system FlhB-like substrate exporter